MTALKYFLFAFVFILSTCGSKSGAKTETSSPGKGVKVVYNPFKGIWYDNTCHPVEIGSKPADYKEPVKNQPSTIFSTEGSKKDYQNESLHTVLRKFNKEPTTGAFDDMCNYYSVIQQQKFGQQVVLWDDEPPKDVSVQYPFVNHFVIDGEHFVFNKVRRMYTDKRCFDYSIYQIQMLIGGSAKPDQNPFKEDPVLKVSFSEGECSGTYKDNITCNMWTEDELKLWRSHASSNQKPSFLEVLEAAKAEKIDPSHKMAAKTYNVASEKRSVDEKIRI